LSESLCIGDRHKGVLGMIEGGLVDILFGNEGEMRQLTGCALLEDCIEALSPNVSTLVITRGSAGAIAIEGGERADVPAASVAEVIDTTGAGDLFAAGFLAGRLRGRELKDCLEAGTIAAGEIISHFGARPEADLKQLAAL
jgi:sugar/nucleoside kinase (ribokinase family)